MASAASAPPAPSRARNRRRALAALLALSFLLLLLGTGAAEAQGTGGAGAGLSVETIDRAGRSGLFLAIGLVHLLLFAFYPRERTNLAEGEIPHILEQSSAALKRMNLHALYMAMLMVKIQGRRMTLGAAGMPPALHYRAASREVEEVEMISGFPLGSRTSFPYRQTELTLAPGDLVVLMSDGFPERLNAQDEMLGYERTQAILAGAATLAPQEIIARFVETAEAWAGGRAQDDDVTFVVIRVRGV